MYVEANVILNEEQKKLDNGEENIKQEIEDKIDELKRNGTKFFSQQ